MASTIKLDTITRSGIYYNLKLSSYKFDNGHFVFYFSSKLNLGKFKKGLEFWKSDINERMYKRFGVRLQTFDLIHFLLYERIEKRGYYVVISGGKEEVCLEELELDGKLVKKKPLP